MWELIGFGFNGFGQIEEGRIGENVRVPVVVVKEAEELEIVFVGWLETLCEYSLESEGLKADGNIDLKDGKIYKIPGGNPISTPWASSPICRGFGDYSGLQVVISGENGRLWVKSDDESDLKPLETSSPFSHGIEHVAIAGNGKVCIVKGEYQYPPTLSIHWLTIADKTRIFAFNSLSDLVTSTHTRIWNLPTKCIIQLSSNTTTFTALTSEGELFTWGDPRHGLGRELTKDEPATEPCIVAALEGMYISKISSGGWITAAVTRDRDLYIWGRQTPGADEKIDFLPDGGDEVRLVDLGEEVDVVDVAVGAGHAVALTREGEVWAAGDNETGQLGMGEEGGFRREWRRVENWKGRARAVVSGSSAWSSFVLAKVSV